ncbi:MAG TPA: tetratricopeptide repeat protein [Anaerolineae bacterium]|nr:tetratricopeptide repeat protein [Anaerolineae bacterium]
MTIEASQQPPAPSAARRRISRDWLLLALLWLIHALATLLWLRMDNRFPVGNAAIELTRALAVADALGRPSLDVLSRVAAASASQPPLPYIATAPLIWLAGRGPDPATLVNLAWLALLMASVYGLTRRLFPAPSKVANFQKSWQLSAPYALAAASLVSLYPLVIASTRIYDPALAAATLAALAIWLLVESDGLQRRPYALGFGLAAAAGLLASSTFWAAVLGPALLVAAQAVRVPRPARGSRRTPSRNVLDRFGRRLRLAPAHVNLLLALLLIALALPFYLLRPDSELPTFPKVGNSLSLLDNVWSGVLLLVLLIGSGYGLWQVIRPQRAGARLAFGLPLAWLGLGLPLLLLLGDGSASQLLPLLPAAAVLSVAWLAEAELPTFRKVGNSRAVIASIIVVLAAVNAIVVGWGHQGAPQRAKSNTAAIGQAAERLCADQTNCRAVVLSCLPSLSQESFDYFLAQEKLGERLAFQELAADVNFYYDLWDADFVLSINAGHGCTTADGVDEDAVSRMTVVDNASASAEFNQRFRQADTFDLPDGSQAQLWRRVGPPIALMDASDQVLALEHILAVTPSANAANQALSTMLEQVGDPARALALREDIVARNPEDRAARVALGDVYLAYGRPLDAVEQYEAALADGEVAAAAGQGLSVTTPEVLHKLADAHAELGQWEDAEAALARAAELAPDDYTSRLRQGQFFVARGRFADATASLAVARRIDPDRFETYLALAQAQLLRNDLTTAEAEGFRLAQQVAPEAPEPPLAWADALAARGDLNQASQRYDQGVNLATAGGSDEAVIDAYVRWIAALETLGSSEQARALAETLAKTYPRSPQALAALAGIYDRQGLAEEAVASFQAALALNPLNAQVRARLARTLAALERYDEAADIVQGGLALPSGRVELLTAQADLLLASETGLVASETDVDRARQAIQTYQEALQSNPAYWPAAVRLAQLFLSRDQSGQALSTVDAALQRQPEIYQLQALRGEALRALGQRQDALAAYRQAIELAPAPLSKADPSNGSLAQIHTRLGELQLEANNFGPAQGSFERALGYAPDYAAAHIGLARLDTALALRESGAAGSAAPVATDENRFEQASRALETALALEPDSVAAYTALGNLYAAYGRTDEASAAYQQALTLDPTAAEEARNQLFALYLAQDRADEVIAFYNQLLRENPGNVSALRGLADAYIATGQTESALETYDLFLAQNRDNVQALMAQGSTLVQLGQMEEALAVYQRAGRRAGPTGWLQPQIEQARTLTSLGRLEEAETSYRLVIQQIEDPDRAAGQTGDLAQPYIGLARLLLLQNRIDEATQVSDAVLAAQPNAPAVQILAGDLSRFQGRRAEALAAYRRALEVAPDNAAAHTRVGDLLLEGGNLAEAQAAFEAALASDPTNTSGLLGLARTLSRSATAGAGFAAFQPDQLTPQQQADLARAQELLDTVLALRPESALAAQLVRADVLFAQGQVAEAADAYQAVLLAEPDNSTAIEGLARTLLVAGNADEAIAAYEAAASAAATPQVRDRWLMTVAATYRSLGRYDEAEQTYLAMIEADPAASAARQALGDLYLANERLDEAIAQYRQAAQIDPNDAQAAFRLGRTLLRVDQVDEAAAIAQSLLANSPSAYQSYLLAARVAQAQGDGPAALASLRQAQSLAPTDSAALTLIGDSFLAAGRLDDAASAYSAAVALEPRNSSALVGLGRVYQARSRLTDAEASLRRALAVAPNNLAAQATLGRLLLRAGRPAEAIPLLEAAVAQRADPSATAVQDLADAYLASDRVEEGLAIYRANLSLSAEDQQLVIGQALLNAGRIEDGLRELEAFVGSRPADPAGLLALAQAYQQAGQTAGFDTSLLNQQADESFQQAVDAAPDDLALRILYGDFLLAQQQSARAADLFQGVVDTVERSGRLDEVRQIDEGAAAETDPSLQDGSLWRAWIGLARAYQQQSRFDEALQAAEAGEVLRPDVPAFALQIGDILRAAGRSDEALAAYTRAASFGASTAPLTRQGDLYLRLGQPDQALQAYEQALALAPGDADALLGLAQAYALRGGGVDQADFANAETRLRRAAQLAPDNVNVPLALGDLYTAYGRHDDAADQYRQALTAQPDNVLAQGRLANALLAAGQLEAALQEQLKLAALRPGDRGPLLGLAITYRAMGRSEDAEATYRQLLQETPNDPVVLVALGDLNIEQGRIDEAVTFYQQALSHSSDPLSSAQAADQLGKAYLRLGQVDQAQAIAEDLLREQPAIDRGYLLLGSVREAQNDPEAALAVYQQGISQTESALSLQLRLGELNLRLGRAADAQAIYEALTKSHPRSVDAFVGLARSHIAQLPDLQALRTDWATQALRTALRLDPNATAAHVAQGDLYNALQRPDDAANAYMAALASRQSSADDSALRLRLADALAAAGRWEQALQEYQRLIIANPNDVAMAMALGNAYRQSGRTQQALTQYRRVNQIAPSYPFAFIRQGEILDELGQPDQALAAYQAAVKAAPDNADVVLTLAVAYRKRGMAPEAIAAFEAGLAIDPTRDAARLALEELRTKGK